MPTPNDTNAVVSRSEIVKTGLHFAESPTVGPDGRLYLSDFYAREVIAVDPTSWKHETIVEVPAQPSGLGWLRDGTLLIVSMRDRRLLARRSDGTTVEVADLSELTVGAANDMYVDAAGRAWIGDFGIDLYDLLETEPDADPLFGPGASPPTATVTLVTPTGTVRTVAQGLRFPNGIVQLSDGRLVIAETVGKCLTSFTITAEDTLVDREVFVDLSTAGPSGAPILPDGICIDADDGIWVSDPTGVGAARLRHGTVTHRVNTSKPCFAVGLVGDLLVCCTADSSNPNIAAVERTGQLEVAAAPLAAG
jgi:sugar lactone lactonase YvrE